MKKLILLLSISATLSVKAQPITFEYNMPFAFEVFSTTRLGDMYVAHYTTAATKWDTLAIYNSDWSLRRVVALPAGYTYEDFYIGNSSNPVAELQNFPSMSDELFNTDTLIEFLAYNGYQCSVINELGQIDYTFPGAGTNYVVLYSTNNNYKVYFQNFNIYSLPGSLPCSQCSNAVTGITSPSPPDNNGTLNLFPNPSSGSINIKYQLPSGSNTGEISEYNLQGRLLKQIPVVQPTDNITVNENEPGTYLFQLETSDGAIIKKQIVIR